MRQRSLLVLLLLVAANAGIYGPRVLRRASRHPSTTDPPGSRVVVISLAVRRSGTTLPFAGEADVVGGGSASPEHQAEIEVAVSPPVAGFRVARPLVDESGEGEYISARVEPRWALTDPSGKAHFTFTSSDLSGCESPDTEGHHVTLTAVGTNGAPLQAVVRQHWDQWGEWNPWATTRYCPMGVPAPVSFEPRLRSANGWVRMTGHRIEFDPDRARVWRWNPALGDYDPVTYEYRGDGDAGDVKVREPRTGQVLRAFPKLSALVTATPESGSDRAGVYRSQFTVHWNRHHVVDSLSPVVWDGACYIDDPNGGDEERDLGLAEGELPAPEAGSPGPPAMPTAFDRATVARLVAGIDQGWNAAILKMGYFVRRDPHGLPVELGVRMLRSEVRRERVGTRRWFVLQSARGFGALRASARTLEDGIQAYEALFAHAADAQQAGADDVVLRAMAEFVSTASDPRRELPSHAGRVYRRALAAYLDYLARGVEVPYRIPWVAGADCAYVRARCAVQIDDMLSRPGTRRTYPLLRLAADMCPKCNADRAIELYQEARKLIPAGDRTEEVSLLDALARAAEDAGRIPLAVATREERIRLTGRGRGKLAALHFASGDRRAFDAVVSELCGSGVSEAEIIETTQMLVRLGKPKPPGDEPVRAVTRILTAYLAGQRVRTLEGELLARLGLCNALWWREDLRGARSALCVKHLKGPFTGAAKGYYAAVRRADEHLRKKDAAQKRREAEDRRAL